MAYEYRPGGGSLFKNKEKRPDKKDADMKGKVMLPDGTLCFFDAWSNTSAAGEKYLSVRIGNPCQQQPSAHSVAKGNGFQPQPVDDDVPW
jgi:hypothetical protein